MRSLFVLAVALSPSFGSVAAEPMDTIIVTGSRTPIEIAKAGASVTVIDRERIEARGVAFVSELLREVPGLAVSRAGGFGKQAQVRVRGAEGNHVMVLIDGIEANDPAGNDEFDFGNLTTAEIERIEIVRGPQSALWGSEALAGVINIITRKAGPGFTTSLALEGGSFATNQQRASVSFGGSDRALRIGVGRLESNGMNVARAGSEDDAYRTVNLDVNGSLQPHEALELSFVLRKADTHNETDSDALLGVPSDTPGRGDTDQTYLGTRAELTLFEGAWVQRADANWSASDIEAEDPAVFLSSRTGSDRYELSYLSTLSYSLRLPIENAHRASFAVDHEYQRFRQRGPVTVFGNPNQDRGMHNTGYVGEYRIDLAGRLSLGGSVRHDSNTSFRDITTYRGSATWRVPLLETVLTLAYGTGQKAPTFLERYGFASGGLFGPVFVGNAGLTPEKSRGWEIGLARTFWSEAVRASATWFSERLRDEIFGYAVAADGATATAVNQAGVSRRDGLELALDVRVAGGVALNTSYTYLDASERDRVSGLRKDEVRRPRHQGSVAIDWRSSDSRWRFGTAVTHTGAFEDLVFLPPTFMQTRVGMDSYTLVGFSGSFAIHRGVELFGRIDNAFDAHYEELFGYRMPGVSGFAGVRLSFAPD